MPLLPRVTNLPDMLQVLFSKRYTGQTLIHWQDGLPRRVDIVEKQEVTLTIEEREPTVEVAKTG